MSLVRLVVALGVVLSVVAAACTSDASTSDDSGPVDAETESTTSEAETDTDQAAADGTNGDTGPTMAPVRHPMSGEIIYFVMPDRFANGDPSNDTAGLDGGPLVHGFLPTDRAYHHGGDLAGLTGKLDYIAELGATAIWITPPFTNKFVQGNGTVEGSSSSYHGYWQVNWDQIDPHLGTEAEMQAFIAAAHDRGLKVIFDVVVNHTGDVIAYGDDSYGYQSLSGTPYVDADGNEIDLAALTELPPGAAGPELDPATSFPHPPVVAPDELELKSPDWLNDVTLYHNRGNTTFSGENSLYGDFFGLDDLFTEHPRVVEGMIELHTDIIERYDVDGFRIDTVKHVNPEFWAAFAPAITAAAADAGKPDFFFFGEVAGEDPILQSSFTNLGITSTLDFLVSGGLERYVAGGGNGSLMADVLDEDDWFTDGDGNASMQVTFFGNHDQGRMGHLIDTANPSADDDTLLARMKLGQNLLFLLRGTPVIYYGDEQGFVGDGGDQLARQDMFESQTPEYVDDDNIGTDATPADDNFDPDHPLYQHLAGLAAFRADNPVFITGAQVVHETDGPLFAFSRIDRDQRVEYVVVTNSNGSLSVPARFTVASVDTTFTPLAVGDQPTVDPVTSDANGEILVEVEPLQTVVLRADQPLAEPPSPPSVDLIRPEDGGEIPTPRYRLEADVRSATGNDRRPVEVTFAVSIDGGEPRVIGVDDAPPYRVYWNTVDVATGATVEIMATADEAGMVAGDRATVLMGAR